MAEKEGSSKSTKRKIEEVEDASDGKTDNIKRLFGGRKEGKRRLIYFILSFFSFTEKS